ncbi:MAG: hypothetical protein MK135_13720 [Polyangiaceae bacterium]|nr:hypothetical protein [Polyangiaceae bacterium]
MTSRIVKIAALALLASLMTIGCAGVQKSLDRKVLAGSLGEKYSEEIGSNKGSYTYGEQVHEEPLADGTTLHLHVKGYKSKQTSFLGIWGKSSYSYRVFAFKVTEQDRVLDWAYALYQPKKKYTHLFGFTLKYQEEPIVSDIVEQYESLAKTSSEASITTW